MPEFGFNPRDYKPNKNSKRFPPIPAGEYWVACTEAKTQLTRKGDGKKLAVRFRITRGEHTDRLIFDHLNVVNLSEDAMRIAREKIHDWSAACGKPDAKGTDELLDVECLAMVDIKEASNGYESRNYIRYFITKPRSDVEDAPQDKTELDDDIPL